MILRDKQFYIALVFAPLSLVLNEIFQVIYLDVKIDIYQILLLIIIAPIIEEIVFRGFIQDIIAKKVTYKIFFFSYANILTSIVFVIIHYVFNPTILALMVFVPSLIFGYFKERYQKITPSIVLHSFYNFCLLIMVVF